MDALKSFTYSSGGSSSSAAYQANWVDITEEFRDASKELKLGELVHDELFGLYDAMAAIELMDPKMDAGMLCNKSKKVLPFEELVARGRLKVDGFTPAELIGILDETFSCLVTWLDGHSLAQTVFTNLYLHNPALVADRSLRAFALVTLKLVETIKEFVHQAAVYEDEDFQPKTYNFSLAGGVTVPKVLTAIKAAEEELARRLKKEDDGEEDNKEQQALLVRLSFTRHFFLFMNCFRKQVGGGRDRESNQQHPNHHHHHHHNSSSPTQSSPQSLKDFLATARQHLATCETLLKQWALTTELGVQPSTTTATEEPKTTEEQNNNNNNSNSSSTTTDYPTILGFEPLINQRLLPPSFPRYTQIRGRAETVAYLGGFLSRLRRLLTIADGGGGGEQGIGSGRKGNAQVHFSGARLTAQLRFLDDFSKLTPSCVVSRSMLQLFFLAYPSSSSSSSSSSAASCSFSPITSGPLLLGLLPLVTAIKESCRAFIRPPVLCCRLPSPEEEQQQQHQEPLELPGVDAQTREIVEGFFARALIPFKSVLQTYGNNRARQREKLALVLKDFGTLIEESVTLDRYLGVRLQHPGPFVFLQYWVFYHKLTLMSQYLLSGFELELYSRHEYAYIFHELEKIWNNVAMLLSQAEQISLQSEAFTKNAALNASSSTGNNSSSKANRKNKSSKNSSRHHHQQNQQPTSPEVVHDREILYYKGISHLAAAYHHLCVAFTLDGRISRPTAGLNTERIRYQHRFEPVVQFEGAGGLLSYDRYLDRLREVKEGVEEVADKDELEGLAKVTARLYLQATDQLLKARTHFEALVSRDVGGGGGDGVLLEEVQSCIKVAKTNTVVINLLRSGHNTRAKPEFAFTESSHFPIIKFSKS